MKFVIEKSWWYRNMQCSVIFTNLGHRCGYIAMPKNTKVPYTDWPYADMDVHGGITFDKTRVAEMGVRHRIRGMMVSDGVHLLGFDCAHYMDGFDADLTEKIFGVRTPMETAFYKNDVVRSMSFCEEQCRSLVDQAINFNKGE